MVESALAGAPAWLHDFAASPGIFVHQAADRLSAMRAEGGAAGPRASGLLARLLAEFGRMPRVLSRAAGNNHMGPVLAKALQGALPHLEAFKVGGGGRRSALRAGSMPAAAAWCQPRWRRPTCCCAPQTMLLKLRPALPAVPPSLQVGHRIVCDAGHLAPKREGCATLESIARLRAADAL